MKHATHARNCDVRGGLRTLRDASLALFVILFLMACASGSSGAPEGAADSGAEELSSTDASTDAKPDVDTTPACVPDCADRECGSDGCDGSCGGCASGRVCSDEALCVPDPEDCSETCESLGLECGEHCGEDCGSCDEAQSACVAGVCTCQPECPLTACGADDGCGALCLPCPQDVSCEDCPLKLSVVEHEVSNGRVVGVTVALDFLPSANAELPGMADLRLTLGGNAKITGVALGEALLAADKELFVNANSGKPYRVLADGSVQLLVLATDNSTRIGSGRWLFLKLANPPSAGGDFAPFSVALVEREQILAPPLADQVLWGAGIGEPVVVWPEVTP